MTRTELINHIIKKRGYKSYLEIGVGTGKNFAAIKCEKKLSVDPDPKSKAMVSNTSDYFFDWLSKGEKTRIYDLIFIDGLHHADQVRRDIINAYACLNEGGCLVIHDTNPDREEITKVPRETKEWCGSVYKAIYQISSPYFFTMQDDHGVTVIRKDGELKVNNYTIEWSDFDQDRQLILNLVTAEQAIKIVDEWK